MKRVIAYTRVSTGEQAENGASLKAQMTSIQAYADFKGWTVTRVAEDAGVRARAKRRLALEAALEQLAAGEAEVLMVAAYDRLARSVFDFAELLERAERERWVLVMLSPMVDLSTPEGKVVAQVMSAIAEFESSLISRRTRSALAERRRSGEGKRDFLPSSVDDRIAELRREGAGYAAIARALNDEGVETLRGVPWVPAGVLTVVRRLERDGVL